MLQKLNSSGELQNYDASNGQYSKDNVNVINTESVVSFKSNKYLTDEEKAEKERRKQENFKKQKEKMITSVQKNYPMANPLYDDSGDIKGFEFDDYTMKLELKESGYTWGYDYSKRDKKKNQEKEYYEKLKQENEIEKAEKIRQYTEQGYNYNQSKKLFSKDYGRYVEYKTFSGQTYYMIDNIVQYETLDEAINKLNEIDLENQKIEQETNKAKEEAKTYNKLSEEEKTKSIKALSDKAIEQVYTDDPLYSDVAYDSTGGYSGYSMSNRAKASYEADQKPISKWHKEDILEVIENNNYREFIPMLEKIPQNVLKNELLEKASWHHTSKMYNATNFYGVVSPQKIAKFIKEYNDSKIKIID